jgi:hypothetical protein
LLIALPDGRTAEHVRPALARRIRTLPLQLRRTLTWDRGKEMAEQARFSVESGVSVYFCDPRSPWQRATSEKTNGLLREYSIALRYGGLLIEASRYGIHDSSRSAGLQGKLAKWYSCTHF